MTDRERVILKAILDVLHDADGHQLVESQIHAAANARQVRGICPVVASAARARSWRLLRHRA